MNRDIQRADPLARRTTLVVLILASVVALLLLIGVNHWLRWSTAPMQTIEVVTRLRLLTGLTLTASALCLALLAAYAARLATRVRQQRRWPLPSARMLRDTPIRRDSAALRIAMALQAGAVVLIALAVAGGALGWRLFVLSS